jgi:hypothetical protein
MTEAEYRLTLEERANLQSDLDHDALEAFLRTLPAEVRPVVLRFARDWSRATPEECLAAFPEIVPRGPLRRQTFIVPQFEDLESDDPRSQAAIDAILAPRRARRPPATPET